MNSIAIIGIGSPYGADQTGWQLVEMLKHDPALQALTKGRAGFSTCPHPGLMLLDSMSGSDYSILIDAVEGGRRGNVILVGKHELLEDAANLSTHNLGVKEVLLLGNQLNSLPQQIDLIGVEVGDISLRYQPEPQTTRQIKHLVRQIVHTYLYSK